MDKEEILYEIEKTKQHLTNLEKMLKECGNRWKPKYDEQYWYITDYGTVNYTLFMPRNQNDDMRFKNYNCFKTREQAEQEAEKILIRRQLEDIARRLNKGKKFEWDNFTQWKRYLYFDFEINCIMQGYETLRKRQGVIYSLSRDFKDVAIKEIGEERLIKYLRGK